MQGIVFAGHPILRQVARPVLRMADRGRLHSLHRQLKTELRDDRGLAAPQLGLSIRAFIVRSTDTTWMAVNPEVVRQSRATVREWETCLSVPHYAAEVERPSTVHVRYNDVDGRRVSRRLSGDDARIFQHELDHLNGILFTDRADLRTITHERFLEPAGGKRDSPVSLGDGSTALAAAVDGGAEADGQWNVEEEYYEEYLDEYDDESEQPQTGHRTHGPEHARSVLRMKEEVSRK
jgi:peptide deformylase